MHTRPAQTGLFSDARSSENEWGLKKEEEETQRIAENALSAENCGHLIVHILDALVHGLAHGHNGIVLGV